ncbi:Acetyltransferase (GNAT) family protein [Pseudonocardia thermophila]|jgi:Predicted acetyltransferase|uniref:Acetyltransferase (GNAT) family protein n=1 Tax=Pseudonocardia thermophila TaxID=1848 RepID=A0A1M6R4U9_PSETH|nr:GNAT family N-acetyltransferase [Pseudonocardia thermophila]SHK27420.1 Acetyltransferase (GNAT) family protein [Pseudonocardia thermophila]
MVEVVLHERVAEFAALAQPLYARDPARHTIALTVLDGMVRHGDPAALLATVHEAGAPVGALLASPGHRLIVSGLAPEHAPAAVAALAAAGVAVSGAHGPTAAAEAFAEAHRARHGGAVRVDRTLRLYELGTLVPPQGVPGAVRPAGVADAELLCSWRAGFVADTASSNLSVPDLAAMRQELARSGGGELLWIVDGRPVAQATARLPVAGMSRIGPVYTPPDQRRRGYAAAVTAAAARWARAAGARHVVLFTDRAEPGPNRLYPQLGFVPVYDGLDLDFVPALVEEPRWRRSSVASDADGGAVEIAVLPGGDVLLRTTASTAAGRPPLRFTPDEWRAFLAGVRAGEFDTP